jgi:dinuclear metal center YbgI/SA1388 family protein
MSNRNKIIQFCEEYLKVADFKDYCKNGLQVEGKPEVNKIVTGVSFSVRLIEKALEKQADMILVHHGLFNNQLGEPAQIKGFMRSRLKLLLQNDINLAGFHLPLDAHPEIGNNISLARQFELSNLKEFNIGFIGELPEETDFTELDRRVKEKLNTDTYTIQAGPAKCRRLAVCSGGASPDFQLAAEQGADTYISGDIRESGVRAMEETGINFINAGHYNTEKSGIYNLGELLKEKFNIEAEFIDIPCDI